MAEFFNTRTGSQYIWTNSKTKVNKPLCELVSCEKRTNELTSGIKNTWANIKPLGLKKLRPLSANSDCQDRAVKPV